jgi:hypothetical protein
LTGGGSIVLSAQSLANEDFGPEGLGSIIVIDQLYFVNRQGKTAPALVFDNGPDYVVEGLVRTVKDGKVGFVNTRLDQVVAPVWDFAEPFQGGIALVCTGCTSEPARPGADEHRIHVGGKWGCIDNRGKVVVPVIYDSATVATAQLPEKSRRDSR